MNRRAFHQVLNKRKGSGSFSEQDAVELQQIAQLASSEILHHKTTGSHGNTNHCLWMWLLGEKSQDGHWRLFLSSTVEGAWDLVCGLAFCAGRSFLVQWDHRQTFVGATNWGLMSYKELFVIESCAVSVSQRMCHSSSAVSIHRVHKEKGDEQASAVLNEHRERSGCLNV